ncbi:hypothetical protein CANCADRAFT_32624 [Tortispora caseinolytica NRRL Y-17796]|uniref:RNA helicase n=1 Tax=Tortispora caseinolytica NRRL Y-17796 TaxID=767744 RepID=A0A1E4TCG1_9ASCO|nr:hypothetical protein CANCADRAFT_32624 [Tortispora caseinolytica NRRL Y-17796]
MYRPIFARRYPALARFRSTPTYSWNSQGSKKRFRRRKPEKNKYLPLPSPPETYYSRKGHVHVSQNLKSSLREYLDAPWEAYPKARAMRRKWIVHAGPTNSGKTYNALQRLKTAKSGLFGGPLRLLAREVSDRFRAQGTRCNLITGEEISYDIDEHGSVAPLSSSTMEMVSLSTVADVAVLDEIQMIADPDRGFAWTQALLGLQAKEIHLCGETRTVPFLKSLAALVGDEIEVNYYERLSPLEMDKSPLLSLDNLRPGDCLVAFSRRSIFDWKARVEKETKFRCAIIYGALPPEVRASQAAHFNDPKSGYDILIASDAIGMGLNLSIDRVIFTTAEKYNGESLDLIDPPHARQIGGRAGRFKLGAPKAIPGLVTTFHAKHYDYIKQCMQTEPEPITRAGIMPGDQLFADLISAFDATVPPSVVFDTIAKSPDSSASDMFYLCGISGMVDAASCITGPSDVLTIEELVTCCQAPVPVGRDTRLVKLMDNFVRVVQKGEPVTPISMKDLVISKIVDKTADSSELLKDLEVLHMGLNSYLWISYRLPEIFTCREEARHLAGLCQAEMERLLETKRMSKSAKPKAKKKTADKSAVIS